MKIIQFHRAIDAVQAEIERLKKPLNLKCYVNDSRIEFYDHTSSIIPAKTIYMRDKRDVAHAKRYVKSYGILNPLERYRVEMDLSLEDLRALLEFKTRQRVWYYCTDQRTIDDGIKHWIEKQTDGAVKVSDWPKERAAMTA